MPLKIARNHGLCYDPVEVARRPLPGTRPLGTAPWLTVRDDYADQMVERVRLLTRQRDAVLALHPEGRPAADELLAQVIPALSPDLGFTRTADTIRCPDGRNVAIDPTDPLGTLGLLLQSDICLMQKQGDDHVLVGAVLCFPSAWTLSEKIGRPLPRIHAPVPTYGPVARRVQRLFDGIQVDRPLWRANLLAHPTDALFQPRPEATSGISETAPARFHRSERQVIWRLPRTRDVVFAIETRIWPIGHPPEIAAPT
ncbi:MAG: DUF3445 domain-containing protein [Pseudomonadota bacterium]